MRVLAVVALLAFTACPKPVIHMETCASYIACAKGLDLTAGTKVEATYGSYSACWADERQSLACVEACEAGIQALKANGVSCSVKEVK